VGVQATLEPGAIKARPGDVAELRVRVRNDGPAVDGFILSVGGPLAPWASIEPPTLRLQPASEAEARLSIRAPREADPGAGIHPVSVSVRSVSDPAAAVVEEGAVDVTPFVALAAELQPPVSRGRRSGRHALVAHNLGNEAAVIRARGTTPDASLRVAVEPEEQLIAAGGAATFAVRVRPRRLRLRGRSLAVPYLLELVGPADAFEPLQAAFEQRPLLPTWFLALAFVLIVAGIAAIAASTFGLL
jgi:hypothetical protein